MQCFGPFAVEFVEAEFRNDRKEMKRITQKAIEYATENLKKASENLKTIRFRTQNPGTQWTSSVNPVFEDPRKFYGTKAYRRVPVFVSDRVWQILQLFRVSFSYWRNVPKDVLILIARYVLKLEYEEVMDALTV